MTKQDLQKELKAKVKPGIKPSQLKRSKSAGDIPKAPPLPNSVPVSRSKSNQSFNDPKYPFTTLIVQQEELEKLRKETKTKSETISLLRKKNYSLDQEVKERTTQNDALLVKLAEAYEELNEVKESGSVVNASELEQNLTKRHQNLKDWFTQYQKTKKLDQELSQNLNEASSELVNQDQKISALQSENSRLKQTNQSLTKDLTLTRRLAEHRRIPLPSSPDPMNYLKYALYALSAVWIVIILLKAQKSQTLNPNQEL